MSARSRSRPWFRNCLELGHREAWRRNKAAWPTCEHCGGIIERDERRIARLWTDYDLWPSVPLALPSALMPDLLTYVEATRQMPDRERELKWLEPLTEPEPWRHPKFNGTISSFTDADVEIPS